MKKLILALALCAFAFASCGDDDENGGNNGNTSSFDGTITGKLKRVLEEKVDDVWTKKYDGDVTDEVDEIRAITYGVGNEENITLCTVPVTNGQFTIKLTTPGSESLKNIANEMADGLTISNRSAKCSYVHFSGYKDGMRVSSINMHPSNLSEKIGVAMLYVDNDVNVSGTLVFDDDDATEKYTYEVNMNLKKGWNTVVDKLVKENHASMTTAGIPANMTWGIWVYNNDK